METSFGELRRKEAININDGKRLGKVSDVVFTYPEGRVQGIVVPGGRGFRWGKAEVFVELKCVTKIGVEWEASCPPPPPPPPRGKCDRRDYGEYE